MIRIALFALMAGLAAPAALATGPVTLTVTVSDRGLDAPPAPKSDGRRTGLTAPEN